ncbi:hypothetical protein PR048_022600 [Dryococelus australis]|uniref:BPTI/Kunitz inhibitor domain-containing protein n=1 Tax=Dryococelus australis TaxID=614101 RepID=A0ABQ9H1H4_9NEOP|nr:hypothetical protein PR048_022600 [Dryococelus australis]
MRVKRDEYGAEPECKGGETGDPRENPPTSGIVRNNCRMPKFGSDPAVGAVTLCYYNLLLEYRFGTPLILAVTSAVVGIMSDNAAGQWVFSGICRSTPPLAFRCLSVLTSPAPKTILHGSVTSHAMLLACLALAAGLLVPPAAPSSDNLWKQFPERCTLPPETGECRSFVHKWFFDPATRTCNTFVWGGCPGNDNRFDTEGDCYETCSPGNYTRPWYMEKPVETKPLKKPKAPSKSVTISPLIPSLAPTPIPVHKRGAELTFQETGHHMVFMFAKAGTYIQVDGQRSFQLRFCREISLQFRTRLPHGLLVYHSVKGQPEGIGPYALYIIVENGQLKVVHVFGKHSTSVTVGKGKASFLICQSPVTSASPAGLHPFSLLPPLPITRRFCNPHGPSHLSSP